MKHLRTAGSLLSIFLLVRPAAAELLVGNVASVRDLTGLSLEELSNVEVTSVSKVPEKLMKAAAAIFVITSDDIRRSGATNIPDALRLAPGLDVQRINSNQWAVGIRGFQDRFSRSILVLIDGRTVYSSLYGGTFWEVQDYPLEDIDRIEVIRGPGGTLWGANAVDGVINIITKNSKDTQGGSTTAGGGSEERGFTSTRYGGTVGDSGTYRVYGKYFDRGPTFHADGNNYDAWQMGQGGFRTDWDPDKRDNLTVQGDLYGSRDGESVTVGSYTAPYSQTYAGEEDLSGANILGRWKRKISSTQDFSLQWYYDRTNRNETDLQELRNTFDFDFQHHLVWWLNQDLVWGLEYRQSNNLLNTVPGIVFDPANRTDHLGTGFIQDQIPLIPDLLRLTFGTKLEHNDYSGWEVEPSGRLALTITEKQTAWTAVSRSVRTPAQADADLDVTLPGASVGGLPAFLRLVGNPDFQPETSTTYEWGYRIQPAQPLFFDLATFYNRYHHLRSGEFGTPFLQTVPTPALIFPVVEGNKFEGETHGLELASTWNAFSWWRWRGSYSLLLMHMRLEPNSTDLTHRVFDTEGGSPRHQAQLQWSVDLPWHLEWDPTARYEEDMPALGIPTYWNLDMRLAWHATRKLEIALVGQNLLQGSHPEFDPTQEVRRSVYGQITYHW